MDSSIPSYALSSKLSETFPSCFFASYLLDGSNHIGVNHESENHVCEIMSFESGLSWLEVRPESFMCPTWVLLDNNCWESKPRLLQVQPEKNLSSVFPSVFLGSAHIRLGSDPKHQVEKVKSTFFAHFFIFPSCLFMVFSKSLFILSPF